MERAKRLLTEDDLVTRVKQARRARSPSQDARTEALLRLQRAAGNESVSALLREEEEEEDEAQQSPVKVVLASSRGRSLDPVTRQSMESRLGHDFSGVRIHTDQHASEAAEALNAKAYTVGSDIVFRSDYAPETEVRQRTLVHELTHVVQQRTGPVAGTPITGGIAVSHPSDRFEQEAERTASRVMVAGTGQSAEARSSDPSLQREEEEQASTTALSVVQRQTASSAISPGELHLDSDLQAELFRLRIEQLLDPARVTGALQNVHFDLASPAKGGPFDFTPAPEERPLVPAGPGPDTPRPGSPGDVVNAIMAVPAVDNAVSRLRLDAADRIRRDWRSLSGGERAAVIVTSVLISGAAIGGVASNPQAREFALQQLDGKEVSVPGVQGLSVQFNRPDANNVGFMLKFDVGSHLPRSWGFGAGE